MLLLVLLVTPLTGVLLSLLAGRKRRQLEAIAIASAAIECAVGLLLAYATAMVHTYDALPFFSINAFGGLILAITVIVGLFATLHAIGYLRVELGKEIIGLNRLQQCYILTRLFMFCMYLAIVTTSPLIMWIAIEASTLSTVFLISFFSRKTDIEAAWKYLIINSVGLLLGLLGTLLFLSQGMSFGGFLDWDGLLRSVPQINPVIAKIGFVLILIGYGTKMGLVPMHTWKPDAYNKAPLPVIALLSGALLNVAFLAILNFKLVTDLVAGPAFSQALFIFFGIISIAVPAFIIYSQTNYKRLFAYSSIEHAGIILLGFGFGGIGIFGAILHMVYHAFAKSLLFLVSSSISIKYNSSRIKDITGILRVLPYSGVLYIIGLLAVVGIPPFGMFFSEFYIALAGFDRHAIISVIMLALLLLVFAGFSRHMFAMLFGPPPEGVRKGEINRWMLIPVALLGVIVLVVGVYLPDFVQDLVKESVMIFARNI